MGLHSVILRGWPKDLRTGWLKVKVTEKDLRLGFLMDFPMGFGLVKQKAMPTVKRTGLLMVIPIRRDWHLEIDLDLRLVRPKVRLRVKLIVTGLHLEKPMVKPKGLRLVRHLG